MVQGILRGFDPYMNIVMDDTVEEKSNKQKNNIGMVVSIPYLPDYTCKSHRCIGPSARRPIFHITTLLLLDF